MAHQVSLGIEDLLVQLAFQDQLDKMDNLDSQDLVVYLAKQELRDQLVLMDSKEEEVIQVSKA